MLRKAGFTWRTGKGSHTIWQHPSAPGTDVTIAGNDGDDAKPYMEREVQRAIRKAGGSE